MPAYPVKNLMIPFNIIRLKYKDVFNLQEFYVALHDYLAEHNWVDNEDGIDHYEVYYGERIDRSGSKQIWIQWRPHKKPSNAPFLTYHWDFTFDARAITTTEFVRDGQKIKANSGELELEIKATIEENYKDEFSKNWFLKIFQELFARRAYRKIILQRRKELYQETYAMQNFIKQWFKLKSYIPYNRTKSFFPSQAWPSHQK